MDHQKTREEIKEFFKRTSIEQLIKAFEELGYKVVDTKEMPLLTGKDAKAFIEQNNISKKADPSVKARIL
jgi:nucleoside diphosphate kinase